METEDQEKEIRLCEEPIVLGKEEYFAGDGIDISDENVISIDKNVVQEKLTAGTGINISEQNDISVDTGTIQEKLTAGNNINISEQNVISATDTTYTAGENINISAQNVISATDTKYTAGKNITISEQNVISAADGEVYTAGDNITIQNNVISATDTKYTAGNAISIDSADNNRIDADIHPADYFTADASESIANGSAEGTIQATFKSVELYGDTTQQTYTGKNLWGGYTTYARTSSDVDFSTNSDGSISMSGTASATAWSATGQVAYQNGAYITLPAGTYCLSIKGNVPVGVTPQIVETTNSSSIKDGLGNFTLSATTNIVVRLKVDSGTSFPTTTTIYPMVEVGSTATSYEPYVGGVPAPNPDYPQDVNVVTGTQTVTVTGKNLFDLNNLSATGISISNGVASGTAQSFNTAFGSSSGGIALSLDEGQYTISIKGYTDGNQSTETTSGLGFRIGYTDGTYSSDVYWQNNDLAPIVKTLSTDSGKTPNRLFVSFANKGQNIWHLSEVQLEKGSATTYEPYEGQAYNVRLGSLELAKIGDYQDYIYKSGDDWYVHKAINKLVFNGTESWTATGGGNGYRIEQNDIILTPSTDEAPIKCDYFTVTTFSDIYSARIDYGISNHNSNHWIVIRDKNWTSATDVTNWLSTHNITVYYALATPTDTQITDADLVSDLNALASGYTYADETNFTITATGTNLPAPIEFEIYKNSLAGMAEVLAGKQDKLVAGSNINITGNVISALGGGSSAIQTLTAADYNWDSTGQGGEPNAVAAWLLNEGWYCASVETHPDTSMGPIYENSLLYVHHDEYDPDTNHVFIISGEYGEFTIYYMDSNGELTGGPYEMGIETLAIGYGNNLPMIYSFPPDGSTVGALGQLFTDTGTMHTYQCTAIDDSDPDNIEYTWQQRW